MRIESRDTSAWTQETGGRYPYAEVISTRKVRAEDGALYLDLKCGNLMVQRITRIQTDQVGPCLLLA